MPQVERDEHGHIRLAELELDRVLIGLLKERFRSRGQKVTVEGKNIGYELRCAPPIPFDLEYTRDLGYGAVGYLRELFDSGGKDLGAMVTIQEEHVVPLPFGSFTDPETGRVRIREVNVDSNTYQVATKYMIRLTPDDLEDEAKLSAIAGAAGMTGEDFRKRFGYVAGVGRPG
jgi:6-phosphofructokinase 1